MIIDINEILEDATKINAHSEKGKPAEKLKTHLDKTYSYWEKVSKVKGIDERVYALIGGLQLNGVLLKDKYAELIKEMYENAIYLHDIGKVNSAFQSIKLKNIFFRNYINSAETNNYKHSLLSAIIYINIFWNKIDKFIEENDEDEYIFITYLMLSFANTISKHHSSLNNDLFNTDGDGKSFYQKLTEFIDLIEKNPCYISECKIKKINNIQTAFSVIKHINSVNFDALRVYILNKLLFSSIISCDYYATSDYYNGEEINDFGLFQDLKQINTAFNDYNVVKNINSYRTNKRIFSQEPINALRSDMFIEAQNNLLKQISNNIFYLEAPTGSGKTVASIGLAMTVLNNLKAYNKCFYVFPYNNLAEQTDEVFDEIFKNNEIGKAVINSITPVQTINGKNNKVDYEKSFLNRIFVHYPMVITSHVNFFQYLFGVSKESNYPLIHLCNSIVILDEIQGYNNSIWKESIMFLERYADLLNIKFIIMSATLPPLGELLPKNSYYRTEKIVPLIEDRNYYFENKLFKDRVKLNFDLLSDWKFNAEKLLTHISNCTLPVFQKILIEFISKKEARELYDLLNNKYKSNPNIEIYELTSNDNIAYKKKVISRTKSITNEPDKKMILIGTQTIEAGIDIDMDCGYKHVSLFDSEEQFLGRVDRSCKKMDTAIVYFFFYRESKVFKIIYGKDLRSSKKITEEKYKKYLIDKNFKNFYDELFEDIEESKSKNNTENISAFINKIKHLNFTDVYKKMQLIENKNYSIYLPHIFKFTDEKGNYIEVDGYKVWNDYKDLCKKDGIPYCNKRIKISKLKQLMDYFIYNVPFEINSDDEMGGIYYISDGKYYVTDEGKFNEDLFKEVYRK